MTAGEDDLDCGDNSCVFAARKGGMRTNGGCRCLSDLPSAFRRQLTRHILAQRARVTDLEAKLAACGRAGCPSAAEVTPSSVSEVRCPKCGKKPEPTSSQDERSGDDLCWCSDEEDAILAGNTHRPSDPLPNTGARCEMHGAPKVGNGYECGCDQGREPETVAQRQSRSFVERHIECSQGVTSKGLHAIYKHASNCMFPAENVGPVAVRKRSNEAKAETWDEGIKRDDRNALACDIVSEWLNTTERPFGFTYPKLVELVERALSKGKRTDKPTPDRPWLGERDEVCAWSLQQFFDLIDGHLDPSGHFHLSKSLIKEARRLSEQVKRSRTRVAKRVDYPKAEPIDEDERHG